MGYLHFGKKKKIDIPKLCHAFLSTFFLPSDSHLTPVNGRLLLCSSLRVMKLFSLWMRGTRDLGNALGSSVQV